MLPPSAVLRLTRTPLYLSLSFDRQRRHFKEWQTGVSASPGLGSLDSRTSESDMPASLLSPQSLQLCLCSPVQSLSSLHFPCCFVYHIHTYRSRQAGSAAGNATTASSADTRTIIHSPLSVSPMPIPPSLPCTLHGLHSTPPPSLPTAHSFFTHTHSLILTHSQETSSCWSYLVHTYYAKVISSKKQNCNDNTALTADAHFVFYFPQVILRLT